jgi:alcohol dehydrogenase (cytochrome c)
VAVAAGIAAYARLPEAARWRVDLAIAKLSGRLEGLSWGEMMSMARPFSGYDMREVINGRGLSGSLANPHQSPEDRIEGARLFRERCSVCHGIDATGGRGPGLATTGFRHGDSNWSLYRTLRDGVPGTAMVPAGLEATQIFQVITFLRERQHETAGEAATEDPAIHPVIDVPVEKILAAGGDGREWLTYSGTLDGHRFSPLNQITSANAASLKVRWMRELDTAEKQIEATPLVASGVVFLTEPPSALLALDAATGTPIWRKTWGLPDSMPLCCGKVNRGVAILGDTVYVGTLDARLLAFDASTGSPKWETRVANSADGYSITTAPVAVGDTVILGVSGGEFGIRGFLASYDAATGQQRWRFDTIPGPGEPGHNSWKGDSWKSGGGPTWVPGSYDAESDLVYWGVGNPSPNYDGDSRLGDNLYTNSLIAVHRADGRLAWHFQFTPHDEHDWDANQTPIVADLTIKGVPRKAIVTANRNGFYYVLDRLTGEFLTGVPFVKQTWAMGMDPSGRPIETDRARPTLTGALIYPGNAGAVNWQPPALNPILGLFFAPAIEGGAIMSKSATGARRKPGIFFPGSGASSQLFTPVVRALDAATGERKWEYFPRHRAQLDGQAGLLATRGGVVMTSSGGTFVTLDAATGRELWTLPLGGATLAPPITFANDRGDQGVIVIGGRTVFLLGL